MERALRGTSTEWQRSAEATRPAQLRIDPAAFNDAFDREPLKFSHKDGP